MQADLSQQPVTAETVSADFVTRLIAYIIDAIIIGVPIFIIALVLPPVLSYAIGFVGGIAYVVYFWTSTGATLGKQVMGLKVVSAETGELLDAQGAIIRYVCYIVSALPLYLGFFWIIWDPNHDAWHDKLAKTKVLKVK